MKIGKILKNSDLVPKDAIKTTETGHKWPLLGRLYFLLKGNTIFFTQMNNSYYDPDWWYSIILTMRRIWTQRRPISEKLPRKKYLILDMKENSKEKFPHGIKRHENKPPRK